MDPGAVSMSVAWIAPCQLLAKRTDSIGDLVTDD